MLHIQCYMGRVKSITPFAINAGIIPATSIVVHLQSTTSLGNVKQGPRFLSAPDDSLVASGNRLEIKSQVLITDDAIPPVEFESLASAAKCLLKALILG